MENHTDKNLHKPKVSHPFHLVTRVHHAFVKWKSHHGETDARDRLTKRRASDMTSLSVATARRASIFVKRKPAYMYVLQEAEAKSRRVDLVVQQSYIQGLVCSCRHNYHAYGRWMSKLTRKVVAGVGMSCVPTPSDIQHQGKILCQDYIYERLKKNNVLPINLDLKYVELHSDVFKELLKIGGELEKMYPDLYASICKQINITISVEAVAKKTLTSVAEHLFSEQVTWGKIVALFCISAALAEDCVRQGHHLFVPAIVDSFSAAIDKHAAQWIIDHGGWIDMVRAFRVSSEVQVVWTLSVCGALLGFLCTLGATFIL